MANEEGDWGGMGWGGGQHFIRMTFHERIPFGHFSLEK